MQLSDPWITPRTSLHPPNASVGNMNLQLSQRTSDVGAGPYCASFFERLQILTVHLLATIVRPGARRPRSSQLPGLDSNQQPSG